MTNQYSYDNLLQETTILCDLLFHKVETLSEYSQEWWNTKDALEAAEAVKGHLVRATDSQRQKMEHKINEILDRVAENTSTPQDAEFLRSVLNLPQDSS